MFAYTSDELNEAMGCCIKVTSKSPLIQEDDIRHAACQCRDKTFIQFCKKNGFTVLKTEKCLYYKKYICINGTIYEFTGKDWTVRTKDKLGYTCFNYYTDSELMSLSAVEV